MASETADKLAKMSIADAQTLTHEKCKNGEEWAEQLKGQDKLPETYSLTKTVIFKPSEYTSRIQEEDQCN